MKRPIILGVTIGDVGGIGPEVAAKAVLSVPWPKSLRLVLIGSASILRREARRLGLPVPPRAGSILDAHRHSVCVWDPDPSRPVKVKRGVPVPAAARAAAAWIEAAAAACLGGELDGMVTAPISKEGLWRAGIRAEGHTDLLAGLTRAGSYAMMLMGGGLRVALATRHIPLAEVSRRLTTDGIVATAELTSLGLAWLGVGNRRVGICGLNPHAGEGGLLGREEGDVIAPAVRRLQREGLAVEGPVPADVAFYKALHGRYGAVVAMYHDQGLGPLKMLGFETGVNLTLGLPIIRTSPDHGTAFDIAGKGIASPASMVAAIRVAHRLARRPNPWRRARKDR